MLQFIAEYWLGFVFGAITSACCIGIKYAAGKKKESKREQLLIKEGTLAILHDRLYQCCMYHLRKNIIDDDDLKNVEYIYKSYHALGGNGTGTELYERVKKLPLKVE